MQLDLDLVDGLLSEVADVEQIGLGTADKLTDGVNTFALEAVVGADREVQILDGESEGSDVIGSAGEGPISIPSASTFSSRARPKSSTRVLPAEASASRAVMEFFVSTSRTSRSKSVRCSTRVASTL